MELHPMHIGFPLMSLPGGIPIRVGGSNLSTGADMSVLGSTTGGIPRVVVRYRRIRK